MACRLARLSRPQADRDGARHSRSCRAACELYQRAAWRLPLRHAHRRGAGLHAAGRREPDRKRRHRGRRLARRRCRSRPTRHLSRKARWRCRSPAAANRTEEAAPCGSTGSPSLASCGRAAAGRLRSPVRRGAPPMTKPWSPRANTWREPATALPATPIPAAPCSPAAGRCRRRSARSIRPTSRPIPRPASANGRADQFYGAMHTGRFPDGGLMYPAMPFGSYTKVTRADSDAIFAYLRSVPPVHQPNRPQELRFPYQQPLADPGLAHAVSSTKASTSPTRRNRPSGTAAPISSRGWAIARCATRRSTRSAATPQSQAFQGGLIPMQNWYAPSLTSNKEAGLGEWSIDEIVDLLRTGVSHRGAVYGPMAEVDVQQPAISERRRCARHGDLSEEPRPGQPAREPKSPRFRRRRAACCCILAQTVYEAQCANCHGADGRGMPPEYPPLAGNPSIQMQSAVNPIRMVLNGGFPPGTAGNPSHTACRPSRRRLSDDEVAAVVTYIRAAWGNRGAAVSPRAGQRAAHGALD